MSKFWSLLMIVCLLAITPGCGSSEPASAPQAKASSSSSASQSDPIAKTAHEFLEALRKGESNVASSKLTPLAQQRIRESDMDFSLLANEAASFTIGKVEVHEAGEASVEAVWSEPSVNGQTQQEQWTLALQNIEGQWYILGIIADEGPGQPALVMDFENPDETVAVNTTTPQNSPTGNTSKQATRPNTQAPILR